MISINEINGLKTLAETQASYLKNRPIYIITEGDLITWKNASDSFDIDTINVGLKMKPERSAVLASVQNKVAIDNVPRDAFGIQLRVVSIPIVNETGDAVGSFSIITPILHPVLAAFDNFAPILSNMFPEGVFLYTTDLQKIVSRQASENFDLSQIQIGSVLADNDIATKTIKAKQDSFAEIDADKYGIPVLSVSYPLYDDTNEIVATFGIVIP